VVLSAVPFQFATDVGIKPLPVITSEKLAPPAVTVTGVSSVMAGTGFALLMTKVTAPEVPPPGAPLKTVTLADPALAMSIAGIAAANSVALT